MDGTAAPGTSALYARGDHVHPTDTSRYAASNPSGYQTAAQVTAALPAASSTTPVMDGTAAVGTGTTYARADHVHPTDTSRAPANALGAAKTGTAYTVAATDQSLIIQPSAAFTLTLPAASSNSGRILRLKSVAAFAVASASANVVPLAGGSATTAILAATAGKWALLQSDATSWHIMGAN